MDSKRFGVVYRITNLKNNKVYIGQTTTSIEKRFKEHLHGKSVIGSAIRKHRPENFKIEEVVSCFSKSDLDEVENEQIKLHKSHISQGGYNVALDGVRNPKIVGAVSKVKSNFFKELEIQRVEMLERARIAQEQEEKKHPLYDKNLKILVGPSCLKCPQTGKLFELDICREYENLFNQSGVGCKEKIIASIQKLKLSHEIVQKVA